MSAQIDLRSLLQAVLTRHFLERKSGRYQLYTADQVRVAIEDTLVECPWGNNKPQPVHDPFAQQAVNQQPPQMPLPIYNLFAHQPNPVGIQLIDPDQELDEDEEELPVDPKLFPRVTSHTNWRADWMKSLSDVRCLAYMKQYVPEVVKVLEAHPGQLFLAGGCFSDMIVQGYPNRSSDWDLFVCADNAQEAEKVMRSAAIILEAELAESGSVVLHVGKVCIKTTTQATTFEITQRSYSIKKIQIVRRLYPSGRHDLIPGCFDLWPSQFIWSPLTGLQCTLPGLISMMIRGFPIDLARRSPAMAKRIEKYVERKQFTCYITGVDPQSPPSEFGWRHPERDSLFEIFTRSGNDHSLYILDFTRGGMGADYEFDTEEARRENEEHQAVIKENPTVWDNLYNAKAGKPHIEIILKTYADFCTERCDLGASLFGPYCELETVEKMNPKTLKRFFKSESLRREFCTAYFVEEDLDEAATLWTENRNMIAEPFVPFFCGQTDASKYWKVDNPGAQGFGQNCPRPIRPSDYYGDDHCEMLCGVPHVEVWTVRYLRKVNGWPSDVERLLCRCLLAMHANDVFLMLKL